MPSSGYVADTFVAGEQPTTAKWNELWGNDASFNSGAGFNDSIVVTRHLASKNVTDAKLSNGKIAQRQGGDALNWGISGTTNYDVSGTETLIQCGAAVSSASTEVTITFPTAYSQPPIVTFGSKLQSNSSFPRISSAGISTTGFAFSMITTSNVRSADACMWLAVGPA